MFIDITILLVEDEFLIAANEKAQLGKYGYKVIIASTGEQSVELAKSDQSIDLILMDINLGTGMDGTQAAEIILKNHDIPIVFLSTHTEPETVEKTQKITSYGYVVKSSSITVLDASIKMALKLFESRNKFQKIFNLTPALICVAGTDGYFKELNNEWQNTFGYTRDELGKIPFSDLIHPDDIEPTNREIEIQLRGGKTLRFVNRYRHKDGSYKYMEWRALPSEQGYLFASALDITDKLASERLLHDSETRYRRLFETAQDGILILDAETGRIVDANPFMVDMLGYTKAEFTEKAIWDIGFQGDIVLNKENFLKLQKTNYVRYDDLPLETALGKQIDVEFVSNVYHVDDRKVIQCNIRDISARKKSESALKESEGKFHAMFEQAAMGVALLDSKSGSFVRINKKYCDLIGYTMDEMQGKTFMDITYPPDIPMNSDKISQLVENEESSCSFEKRYVRKDGTMFWGNLTISPLWKNGERPEKYFHIAIIEDISERKRMEASLLENDTLLKVSQSISHIGSWQWEVDRGEVVWSDEMYRIFGVDKQCNSGRLGDIAQNAIHPEDLHIVLPENADNIANLPFEYRIILPDGSIRHIAAQSGETIFDESGKPQRMLGVAQDITERRLAEAELSRQHGLVATLMTNMQIGVYMVEVPSGKTLLANDTSFKLLGRGIVPEANSATLTKTYNLLKYDSNEPYPNEELPLVAAMSGESKHVDDVIVVNPDGTRRMLEVFGAPIYDKNGVIWASLVSFQDITERKYADEKIKALLAEKELILKEVHHRIKNNMSNLSSLLSLQAHMVTEPSAITALEDATARFKSMSLLYDRLYRSPDFTRLSVKDYLPALIDEIVSNFPNSKMMKVERFIQDFELDARRLQPLGIIINELITNIMKHAFKGRDKGLIIVTATNTNGKNAISVEDDGNGIPESVSFENSTGFGLQLIQGLTQQLKGTIRIERVKGTKIVLEFEA
ncbi:MAG: PAS domain S-box protein [Spirochaetota bacterium]